MFWRSGLGGTLAFALILCAPAGARAASDAIPQDPALRSGTLENGLRYVVMRGATPKGAVSVRFAVDVGSYEETEAERGLAHFVEHMAFRATRNFEEGRLGRELATLGVGAGSDHNAFTNLSSTIYQLDLPDGDEARLKLAFLWLRDVADGISFDPQAVARERGVVLAEKAARSSREQAAWDQVERFQGPDLRSVLRSPIGLEAVLRAAGPEDLRRFHDHWYRPDTAMVAVAGDLPIETMVALVREHFSSWRAAGPPPVRAPVGRPDMTRGVDGLAITDPGLQSKVRVCRLAPAGPVGAQDLDTRRRQAMRALWVDILNTRLDERADHDPDLTAGGVTGSDDAPDVFRLCLEALPKGAGWDRAMTAIDGELRRLQRDGPTEGELEAALERARAGLRGGIAIVSTESTPDLANEMIEALLARKTFADPRQLLRAYGQAVEDLTPEMLRDAVRRDWAGAGPLIDAAGAAPPDRAALLRFWGEAETAAPPPPYVDPPKPTWAYADFGPPGRVARREAFTQPDFVRVTFRNGVVLNFKQTDFAKASAEVRVSFGAGRGGIAADELFKADLAANLVIVGGLGRQSYREIAAALEPGDWAFSLSVADESFILSATPIVENLGRQLEVMAAYLSDPGFRPQIDAHAAAAVDDAYRDYDTDPSTMAAYAAYAEITPREDPRPPRRADFGTLSAQDVARLFRPAMTEAPLEVTIVGDLDEKTATALVARSLGALPPRIDHPRTPGRDAAPPHDMAGPLVRMRHAGPANRAAMDLIWPLYVSAPGGRRDNMTADLLAALFADALTHAVRDRLGKTYSPDVTADLPAWGGRVAIEAVVETTPTEIEAVRAETLAVAGRLARGEITAAELEAARAPRLRALAETRQTNDGWAGFLTGASRSPEGVENLQRNPRLMAEIGLDEIRAAAARWLTPQPIQITVLPGPEEAPR